MLSDTQPCYESIMWGRCLAWYDASLGRWRSLVRIRPTPYFREYFHTDVTELLYPTLSKVRTGRKEPTLWQQELRSAKEQDFIG